MVPATATERVRCKECEVRSVGTQSLARMAAFVRSHLSLRYRDILPVANGQYMIGSDRLWPHGSASDLSEHLALVPGSMVKISLGSSESNIIYPTVVYLVHCAARPPNRAPHAAASANHRQIGKYALRTPLGRARLLGSAASRIIPVPSPSQIFGTPDRTGQLSQNCRDAHGEHPYRAGRCIPPMSGEPVLRAIASSIHFGVLEVGAENPGVQIYAAPSTGALERDHSPRRRGNSTKPGPRGIVEPTIDSEPREGLSAAASMGGRAREAPELKGTCAARGRARGGAATRGAGAGSAQTHMSAQASDREHKPPAGTGSRISTAEMPPGYPSVVERPDARGVFTWCVSRAGIRLDARWGTGPRFIEVPHFIKAKEYPPPLPDADDASRPVMFCAEATSPWGYALHAA
ncbi:hypothetical protein FB451DRAFT_1178614 [Mycena latifolia]|nr:hypothetical protein FB451DRAFT_1178614 [Mycena latifolia]